MPSVVLKVSRTPAKFTEVYLAKSVEKCPKNEWVENLKDCWFPQRISTSKGGSHFQVPTVFYVFGGGVLPMFLERNWSSFFFVWKIRERFQASMLVYPRGNIDTKKLMVLINM